MRKVFAYVDNIFCDIKLIDGERHKKITGVDNKLILENIRIASQEFCNTNTKLILRMPLIPSINDDEENIKGTAEFIKTLNKDIALELLPYHEFAKNKYTGLAMQYIPDQLTEIKPPQKEQVQTVESMLRHYGITVITT